MPAFDPVASGPVDSIIQGQQVAEQSSQVVFLQPGLILAEQSAYIVILKRTPVPPSTGRRRQYYIM